MHEASVLRIITAKGAGDGILKRINDNISNGLPYSLSEICGSQEIMYSLGISQEVARNIYESKEKAFILQEQLYEDKVDMCWVGDNDYPVGLGD